MYGVWRTVILSAALFFASIFFFLLQTQKMPHSLNPFQVEHQYVTKSSSVGHKVKFADRFLGHTFVFHKKRTSCLELWRPSADNEEMNLWTDVNTETPDQKKRTWVPSVIIKYLNWAWSHSTFMLYITWSITFFPCITYLYLMS